DLYAAGVEVSSIHRVLSMGMLGLRKKRKLVPTRWSITATDDVISKNLAAMLDTNPSIDTFEVTMFGHLDNMYSVILIPSPAWSFEMFESWFTPAGEIAFGSDYESPNGLDHYPTIAGAYFAGRLAVAEHLSKRKRISSALVLREIRPGYVMPMGVWQIREGVREALKSKPECFESIQDALEFATRTLSTSAAEIARNSRMIRELKHQTRLTDFLETERPKGDISAGSLFAPHE
ncbi:MAG TPA: hypothetical protein VFA15_08655, partial [Nitrososphaera sp.]|nr:hypothetical protein [Nitrososphaera sp.]